MQGHHYHSQGITCLTINSDSTLALTGSSDGSVHVVNISTGQVLLPCFVSFLFLILCCWFLFLLLAKKVKFSRVNVWFNNVQIAGCQFFKCTFRFSRVCCFWSKVWFPVSFYLWKKIYSWKSYQNKLYQI